MYWRKMTNKEKKVKPLCVCFSEEDIESIKKSAHGELLTVSAFLRKLYHDWIKSK